MKVVQPITITPDMVVESNLFGVAPTAYAAGTTYSLGAYASVTGTLGEILIYKSLQAGNIGHTPSSSPTWWVYSSSTYEVYSSTKFYSTGFKVLNPSTGKIMESLLPSNVSRDINGGVSWFPIGKTTLTLPAAHDMGTAYLAGDLVKTQTAIGSAFENSEGYYIESVVTTVKVYIAKVNTTGDIPASSPTQWEFLKSYPVPYEATGNYMLGYVVKDTDGNIYQSLVDNNYNTPLIAPTAWLEVSVSNPTAPFDVQTRTVAKANKEITFTVVSGIIDTIGLINVNADLAVITVREGLGGTVVFQKTIGLAGGNPTNAWDYYFLEPALRATQTIIEGIPPYVNSHVTVTLTGEGVISIGNLIMGKSKEIGLTEYGATSGILDFSTKTTDSFGLTSFVKRGFKKTVNLRSFVENSKLNVIQNNLYSIRATPCLWVASNDTRLSESLVVYGYYKDFNTEISYPEHSYITIEIEGLI